MNRVAFRADVSPKTGMGHLMRCLALAHSIEPSGGCVLITRPDDRLDDMIAPAEAAGWDIRLLDPGLTDAADAAATGEAVQRAQVDLVVTDLCSRSFIDSPKRLSVYHEMLCSRIGPPVLSIEDCRMESFASDVAVIPYECGDPCIADRAAPGCRVFAGPEFYIGDTRLSFWRAKRVIRAAATKILVVVGGSDPLGVAVDVARALSAVPDSGLEVRVIAGHGLDPERRVELRTLCDIHPMLEMIDFVQDIGEHLVWADLAVLGEGLVRFEAAITGTPSITISQFEHHSDVLERFFSLGTTTYLGPAHALTPDSIIAGIRKLALAPDQRRSQSETGMKIYDGMGCERIAAIAAQLSAPPAAS
tara:strand:- start:22762 stop:23844 length:1083 start_codon:yes stop_codon:yes gene_type:complete